MNSLSSQPIPVEQPKTATRSVEVDTKNFVIEVMEASHTQLVIVDFWAPWCGPCKQLAPALEKAVSETNEKAKLVKINIDTCPQIAQQLRVQSIPAVFAFFNKQIVDGFMGAIPEQQIKMWLAELIKATGATGPNVAEDFTSALKQANEFLDAGTIDTARAIFEDVLGEQPDNLDAFAGLLRAYIAKGEHDKAMDRLAAAPAEIADHKALAGVRIALELAEQAKSGTSDVSKLEAALKADENNHQARFDLALALYADNKTQEALTQLMDIVRRDRKWNEEAARKQLVKILETLGFDHPLAVDTRKHLSSILFS